MSKKETNFCYKIETSKAITDAVTDVIIKHVIGIYSVEFEDIESKKKDDNKEDVEVEQLPFIVQINVQKLLVCIHPIGTFKKDVLLRIKAAHKKLTPSKLVVNSSISLGEPFFHNEKQFEWWNNITNACIKKGIDPIWNTYIHNGPEFGWITSPYVSKNAKIGYNGKMISITVGEEEVLILYAKKLISESIKSNTGVYTKTALYRKNFWKDFWQKYATSNLKKQIPLSIDIEVLDWSDLIKKQNEFSENNKLMRKDPAMKRKITITQQAHKNKYGFAQINGTFEVIEGGGRLAGLRILDKKSKESSSLGRIIPHVVPEDVILNLSKGAPIPVAPGNRKWGNVINSKVRAYCWKFKTDILGGKNVYPVGQFKQLGDICKYELARKMNMYIDDVRSFYVKYLTSSNIVVKQCATVTYLLETLGIRPGSEEQKIKEFTFGCTTLEKRHISFPKDKFNTIILKFTGKSSVIYDKTTVVSEQVYKNLIEFTNGKSINVPIFNKVSSSIINDFIQLIDKKFSSKVFRTRLCSAKVVEELSKLSISKTDSTTTKKAAWINVNQTIAVMLNHQRTVNETKDNEAMTKLNDTLKSANNNLISKKKKLKQMKKDKKSKEQIEKYKITVLNAEIAVNKKNNNILAKKGTGAASTSLASYIDPRLVVAWCNKIDLDISNIYTTVSNLKKFKWAIDMTTENWDYVNEPLYKDMKGLQPKKSSIDNIGKGKLETKKNMDQDSEDEDLIIDIDDENIVINEKQDVEDEFEDELDEVFEEDDDYVIDKKKKDDEDDEDEDAFIVVGNKKKNNEIKDDEDDEDEDAFIVVGNKKKNNEIKDEEDEDDDDDDAFIVVGNKKKNNEIKDVKFFCDNMYSENSINLYNNFPKHIKDFFSEALKYASADTCSHPDRVNRIRIIQSVLSNRNTRKKVKIKEGSVIELKESVEPTDIIITNKNFTIKNFKKWSILLTGPSIGNYTELQLGIKGLGGKRMDVLNGWIYSKQYLERIKEFVNNPESIDKIIDRLHSKGK
jgi:hypothetical protein